MNQREFVNLDTSWLPTLKSIRFTENKNKYPVLIRFTKNNMIVTNRAREIKIDYNSNLEEPVQILRDYVVDLMTEYGFVTLFKDGNELMWKTHNVIGVVKDLKYAKKTN